MIVSRDPIARRKCESVCVRGHEREKVSLETLETPQSTLTIGQQFRTRDTRRHWTTLDNITSLYQTLPEVQQTQAIDCLSGLTRRWTCLNSKSKPLQNFCSLPFHRHLFSPPRVHPINRSLLFKRPGSARRQNAMLIAFIQQKFHQLAPIHQNQHQNCSFSLPLCRDRCLQKSTLWLIKLGCQVEFPIYISRTRCR